MQGQSHAQIDLAESGPSPQDPAPVIRQALTSLGRRAAALRAPGSLPLKKSIQRLTQRTVKCNRCLKNHLDSVLSWARALARLAKIHSRS